MCGFSKLQIYFDFSPLWGGWASWCTKLCNFEVVLKKKDFFKVLVLFTEEIRFNEKYKLIVYYETFAMWSEKILEAGFEAKIHKIWPQLQDI